MGVTNIAATNPGVVDSTKRIKNCGTVKNTKEVREAILKASARPTAVYKQKYNKQLHI